MLNSGTFKRPKTAIQNVLASVNGSKNNVECNKNPKLSPTIGSAIVRSKRNGDHSAFDLKNNHGASVSLRAV